MRLFSSALEKLCGGGEEPWGWGGRPRCWGGWFWWGRKYGSVRRERTRQDKKLNKAVAAIRVEGLQDSVVTEEKAYFLVRIKKKEGLDAMNVFVECVGAGPVVLNHRAEELGEDVVLFFAFRISLEGQYYFHLRYLDIPLQLSHHALTVEPREIDEGKIQRAKCMQAVGKGLSRGWVGEDVRFKVSRKGGELELDASLLLVVIDSPNGSTLGPLSFLKSRLGVEVTYKTSLEGSHLVHVKWDGWHIRGSPFQVQMTHRPLYLEVEEEVKENWLLSENHHSEPLHYYHHTHNHHHHHYGRGHGLN